MPPSADPSSNSVDQTDDRRAQERWTVMSRTPSEGGYGWLTIIDGPQIGQDGETFEVVRADSHQGAVPAHDPRAVEAVAHTFRDGPVFCEADWTTLAEEALEAALVATRGR